MTYNEKSFLLWCWCRRLEDNKYILMSKRQDCPYRVRNTQWYADYLGVLRQNLSLVFVNLRRKNIIKTEFKGLRNEVTYVDFTVFS